MKGVGFFFGGLLLDTLGFRESLWLMAALLALILCFVIAALPPMMGKARASRSAKEFFAKNSGINLLAAARVGLFGARDVWFVVGVPVFLYSTGWTFTMVGTFLAVWTIGYGAVQAAAPSVIRRSDDGLSFEVPAAKIWSFMLAIVPSGLSVLAFLEAPGLEWIVVVGLALFGVAFAVNSSLHSYLVLAYAGSEKARGCWVLLCCERGRPFCRHFAFRLTVSVGRYFCCASWFCGDAVVLLVNYA